MQHDPPAIMVFAAGFGTRMKHLTKDRPKPLIPVAGQTLIDHTLALAEDVKPAKIVVNLHYLPDQMQAHLANRDVTTIVETPDILDTGGGLRNALPVLGPDPVITMNSDAIWAGANPLNHLLAKWDPASMDALLMCVPRSRVHGRVMAGDFDIDRDGQLRRGGSYVYGGIQVLKTDRLEKVTDTVFSLNVIWDQMAKDRRLFGCEYAGHWCDVGHPGGIGIAEQMLDVHGV
ncbi:MAG: nucleotidyltransferase family protein [Tateyamaria sp.]